MGDLNRSRYRLLAETPSYYEKRVQSLKIHKIAKIFIAIYTGFFIFLLCRPETRADSPKNFLQSINHVMNLNRKGQREKCNKSSPVILPTLYDAEGFEAAPLNSTLGFQKIFVLNLPRRTDRRDLMALMALASDIDLEFFDGIDANGTHSIKLPPINLHKDLNERRLTDGQKACYRSNLNIMRYIVENRIQSALIVQDDADWDINFRLGLQRLQGPFYQLLEGMKKPEDQCGKYTEVDDPWKAQEWDLFWLGSSYEREWPDKKTAPYVLYNDDLVTGEESVEPGGKNVLWSYGLRRAKKVGDPLQRIVQRSRRPVAMAAYAVTLSGAAQILAKGTREINQPYDSTVCSLSRVNGPGYAADGCILTPPIPPIDESVLRSYTVWPPLVNQFRSSDGARDSDLTESRRTSGSRPGTAGFALEIKDGLREKILQQEWFW